MNKVFFIDDSETALAATKMTTANMNIEHSAFLTAQGALDQINAGVIPNLVITDLNMPEMNGFEFLEAFRNNAACKKTPVLMLTTETSADMKQRGKALGLTGWVEKPFSPAKLKSAIERVLKI
jgi:two-component system, chemotaxis family, chemotaxis protein CheY